ncbi:P protein [Frankliniella fusca]|uniref:P protein n=1 Tax=Frankliniella fusca TaxID=407009 RepID=A0AAE1L7C9_9NEOP|nr:P protein [Frankliniella fusca]
MTPDAMESLPSPRQRGRLIPVRWPYIPPGPRFNNPMVGVEESWQATFQQSHLECRFGGTAGKSAKISSSEERTAATLRHLEENSRKGWNL